MDWPSWPGETVVVVATGPSAADVPLELAKGRAKVIAVKDGWKLCPWADALYACDHHWWEAHRGVLAYQGIRICYDARTVEKWRGIPMLQVTLRKSGSDMLFDKIGTVGWGGHSGFHALNLAAQFGAKRILLIGFDMRVDRGQHFFGPHPYSSERPSSANMARWVPIMDAQAPALAARGIEVVNCSAVSALTAYPKMDFEEALCEAGHLHRV